MTLSYPNLPGDLDHLIADDHAAVLQQVENLEAGHGNRRILVDQMVYNVALHAHAEEMVFYPALAEAGRRDEVKKLRFEYTEVKDHLVVIHRGSPGEAAYEAAVTVVIAAVRKHVTEEEELHLPDLRFEVGPEKMGMLGLHYTDAKRTFPTYTRPHTPTPRRAARPPDAEAAKARKQPTPADAPRQGAGQPALQGSRTSSSGSPPRSTRPNRPGGKRRSNFHRAYRGRPAATFLSAEARPCRLTQLCAAPGPLPPSGRGLRHHPPNAARNLSHLA